MRFPKEPKLVFAWKQNEIILSIKAQSVHRSTGLSVLRNIVNANADAESTSSALVRQAANTMKRRGNQFKKV